MADNKGVMIFTEVIEGKLAPIARELLGAGRKLANDLTEELSALVVGSGMANIAAEAITFGADKVYVADAPLLKDYRTDSYVAVVEKVIKQAQPRINGGKPLPLKIKLATAHRDAPKRIRQYAGIILSIVPCRRVEQIETL